jgi:hypothetical protein
MAPVEPENVWMMGVPAPIPVLEAEQVYVTVGVPMPVVGHPLMGVLPVIATPPVVTAVVNTPPAGIAVVVEKVFVACARAMPAPEIRPTPAARANKIGRREDFCWRLASLPGNLRSMRVISTSCWFP